MHNILEMLLTKWFYVVALNECFPLLFWTKYRFLQLFLNWLFSIVAQGKVEKNLFVGWFPFFVMINGAAKH